MKYKDLLGKETSLSKALSENVYLEKIILSDNKPIKIKSSKSLLREFNEEKWAILFNKVKENKNLTIEDLESIEDGNIRNHIFYKNKHYIADSKFLRVYIKNQLAIFFKDLINNIDCRTIIELGSGYGSKLLFLHKEVKRIKSFKHIALDISEKGLKISKHFADLYELNLDTYKYDYRKKGFNELGIKSKSILFTIYGLHYKKQLMLDDIIQFIESGVKAGIHFEPCSNLIDNLEDKLYRILCRKYLLYNNYTLGISEVFKEAEKKGIIKLKIYCDSCGNGLLPCNWLKWEAT